MHKLLALFLCLSTAAFAAEKVDTADLSSLAVEKMEKLHTPSEKTLNHSRRHARELADQLFGAEVPVAPNTVLPGKDNSPSSAR